MSEIFAHAEVRLWSETVGAVAELDDGRIVFEYAESFRRFGLEISPVHLPLAIGGPRGFPELQKKPAFDGLPGVLADASPDSFGNRVIRAYYQSRGDERRALSPVQRLLYVGERAIGALTFHPAQSLPRRKGEREPLEVAALVADARRILEGKAEVTIPEIYRIGASAGGMRPKALVLHDPKTNHIRSGNAPALPHEVPAILKFDGVGDGASRDSLGEPQPYNRIEAAYASMAKDCGVDAAEVTLLEDDGHAHLLVRRFDREGERHQERIHQHTLGGLLHVDYNEPGASSYEEYFRAILRLGMPYAALEQGFRRMVFNLFAVNQDDHVKNLSFQMDRTGKWRLAPAYDLTFAKGRGFTARHQMRVADRTEGFTRADLLAVATSFDVDRPEKILDRTREVVRDFPRYAEIQRVPRDVLEAVKTELGARAAQLA